jgi:hypothetical protein
LAVLVVRGPILGLVIFAGLTMVDFQRLRRSIELDSAPLIAASIFLDAVNVFSFFRQLFGAGVGTENHAPPYPISSGSIVALEANVGSDVMAAGWIRE